MQKGGAPANQCHLALGETRAVADAKAAHARGARQHHGDPRRHGDDGARLNLVGEELLSQELLSHRHDTSRTGCGALSNLCRVGHE